VIWNHINTHVDVCIWIRNAATSFSRIRNEAHKKSCWQIMISRINCVDLVQRTFSALKQLIHMFLPAKLIFLAQSSEQSMCPTVSPWVPAVSHLQFTYVQIRLMNSVTKGAWASLYLWINARVYAAITNGFLQTTFKSLSYHFRSSYTSFSISLISCTLFLLLLFLCLYDVFYQCISNSTRGCW